MRFIILKTLKVNNLILIEWSRTDPDFWTHRQMRMLHPVPGPCKWLKHMLKLLVYILTLGRVVLVSRSNISKICGLKVEDITNN